MPVEDKSDDVINEERPSEVEGYTVQLLENQMKTILNSIKLLDEIKDEGKKESMLKPLLLQQTILQKMIDQEKQNQTEITKTVASPKKGEKTKHDLMNGDSKIDGKVVRENRKMIAHDDIIVTAEQCVELEAVNRDFDERLSPTDDLQRTEKKRKKLAVNLDMIKDDVLIVDSDRTETESDSLKKEEEMERLRKAEEESAAMKAREEEELRKIEAEKQEMENAKREQEEKRKVEEEKMRIQEELRRMEEERQKRIKEEKERKEEEKRIREEERRKEEQMKREMEEKRLIEEQAKREIEKKLRLEEQAKKEREEEERRKMAEQTEIELLRKELEKQKKQENERLEKERKEIEDLKKKLKEQQELQEKEKLEREQREKDEYRKFMNEMKTSEIKEEKKLFKVIKDISFEDDENIVETIGVEENKETEESKGVIEYQEPLKDTLPEVVNDSQPEKILKILPDVVNNNSVNTEVSKEIEIESKTNANVKSPIPEPIAVDKDQKDAVTNKAPQTAMKPNPGFVAPRRPSANFVSSASRSSDTETAKKPLLGLYAKIQEMANSRASTTSNATSTVSASNPSPPSTKPELIDAMKAAPKVSSSEADRPSTAVSSTNESTAVAPKTTVVGRQPQITASSNKQPASQPQTSPIHSQTSDIKANLPVATAPLSTSNAPESRIIAKKPASDVNVTEIKPKENVISSNTSDGNKENSGTNIVPQRNGPFTNMMPVSFKPQGFRPTSSFLAKLSEKSQEGSKISPSPGPVTIGENRVSEVNNEQERPNEIMKESSVSSQMENKSATLFSRNSLPDIFGSRQIFVPDVSGNDFKIKTETEDKSDIGNYRPKCLSPDDLRSTFDSGSTPTPSATPSSSSAAILRNTMEKKAPPKTLPKTAPKTLPKTLPKPAGKQEQTTEEPNKRASVKDKINSFNLPQKGTNEKRKEYLHLAAIPNRSAEISSGNISSNIMNKPIVHEEKKERSSSKVGDTGRKLPTTPDDSSNTGHLGSSTSTNANKDILNQLHSGSVATESVQAPSLLRRLSLNSLQNETSPTNTTPRDVTPRETPLVLKESPEETALMVQAKGPNAVDNNANSEPVKLGNYASVRDVDKNENSGRDTVTVKKVGGLKIGFGRDKPKIYHC